jgi:hypothetical protein
MSVLTKWSVLQDHPVGPTELDAEGAVRADVLEAWIDAACREYLAQCDVVERTRAGSDLAVSLRHDPIPVAALPGRPAEVYVSASATEIWPAAFAISVRLRPINGASDRMCNVVCRVELRHADGTPAELGDEIRDELIALEREARHYN